MTLLVVLQFTVRDQLGGDRVAPDFLLLALLLYTIRAEPGKSAAAGFLVGLLRDALTPVSFGAGALAGAVAGAVAVTTTPQPRQPADIQPVEQPQQASWQEQPLQPQQPAQPQQPEQPQQPLQPLQPQHPAQQPQQPQQPPWQP